MLLTVQPDEPCDSSSGLTTTWVRGFDTDTLREDNTFTDGRVVRVNGAEDNTFTNNHTKWRLFPLGYPASMYVRECTPPTPTPPQRDSRSAITRSYTETQLTTHIPPRWPWHPARPLPDYTPGLDMPMAFYLLAGLAMSKPSTSCSDTEWCDDRTLDFRNDKVRKSEITGNRPHVRLTGAQINMELYYSNLKPNGRAKLYNQHVTADVSRCPTHNAPSRLHTFCTRVMIPSKRTRPRARLL